MIDMQALRRSSDDQKEDEEPDQNVATKHYRAKMTGRYSIKSEQPCAHERRKPLRVIELLYERKRCLLPCWIFSYEKVHEELNKNKGFITKPITIAAQPTSSSFLSEYPDFRMTEAVGSRMHEPLCTCLRIWVSDIGVAFILAQGYLLYYLVSLISKPKLIDLLPFLGKLATVLFMIKSSMCDDT